MTDKMITIIQDNEERVAEIILTYFNEDTNKNYVIFEFLDTGEVSAAIYTEENEFEGTFSDIETEEEWDILEEILAEYYDSLEEDE